MTDSEVDRVRKARLLLDEALAMHNMSRESLSNNGVITSAVDKLAGRIVVVCRNAASYPDDEKQISRFYDAGAETWHAARVAWVKDLLVELLASGVQTKADLHRFPNLAAATAYHTECERREPGCWEIVESGWSYTVRRKRGDTTKETP